MRTLLMRLPVVVIVIGACGGNRGAQQDTAHAKAGPSACEKMADHLVGVMMASGPKGGEQPTETIDAITRVMIDRCVTDGWTIDAQQCFGTVATLEATSECAPLLTVAQREAMDRAIDETFGPRPGSPESANGAETAPAPAAEPMAAPIARDAPAPVLDPAATKSKN